ncbi:hypothetical protein PPTG_09499 [Phytophthora nicotianae INRA-310]|uniref:Uncharacterized protein n=1 Tax=Phytophthora nicotianae (strain INRA-310) TaxID=761204 RepID=W2QG29_PHYN3|nr:hypothetical protein PPTG_09499 [Phytophthora nicotianae INRA-310]ETN11811.1 hypothetical protein PPTG_09499 [Phytophthora nicotianae INRA-310]
MSRQQEDLWKKLCLARPGRDPVFYKPLAEQLENLNTTDDIKEEDVARESDTDEEDRLECDGDILLKTRWSRVKLEENILKTPRPEEFSDECIEQASPNSLMMLRWVGTLLLGVSILLTWPIGLAYLQG